MALWWLLRAGVAVLGLLGYLVPAELCELLERLEGVLEGLRPSKRQP